MGKLEQNQVNVRSFDGIQRDVSRGTHFYTVELVNATGENFAPQSPMSAVYKMITTIMLLNKFEPGFGLGRNS